MRVLSRVVGAALGLLVVNGCSSPDPSDPAGAESAGTGGETAATAGSHAGNGGSGSGGSDSGGLGGGNFAGSSGLSAGSGGLSGGSSAASGGSSAGSSAASGGLSGASTAGSGGGSGSGGGPSHRLSIRFDYRFDTVGFFTAERRVTLEAAGAVWSNLIRDDFDPVPKGTAIRVRNPENRDEYLSVNLEQDIDDLLVFVGTSEAIPGLGRGGSSVGTETTNVTLGAALAARSGGADFEPWAGSISFKASSNFFFDQTPGTSDDVPFEMFDFISIASHELGHVLGFGASTAFTNLTSGTTFIGPAAQAKYGGPVPLVTDLGHFQDHLPSDGMDTLMDPGIPNGSRLVPTQLDRAVFADIGYEISP
jgi:hypothetical protein